MFFILEQKTDDVQKTSSHHGIRFYAWLQKKLLTKENNFDIISENMEVSL